MLLFFLILHCLFNNAEENVINNKCTSSRQKLLSYLNISTWIGHICLLVCFSFKFCCKCKFLLNLCEWKLCFSLASSSWLQLASEHSPPNPERWRLFFCLWEIYWTRADLSLTAISKDKERNERGDHEKQETEADWGRLSGYLSVNGLWDIWASCDSLKEAEHYFPAWFQETWWFFFAVRLKCSEFSSTVNKSSSVWSVRSDGFWLLSPVSSWQLLLSCFTMGSF